MKQFDLTHLPKVSRAELAFQKQKSQLQLDLDAPARLVTETLGNVEPKLFDGAVFRFKTGSLEKRERTLHALETTSLHLFGALPALNSSLLLCVPQKTAKELVYSLLGSTASTSSGDDSLSAIEEGIFTFIVTTVLAALQPHLDALGVAVRLTPLAQVNDASYLMGTSASFIVLDFEMTFQETTRDIRLVLENTPALLTLFETPYTNTHNDLKTGLNRAGNAQVAMSVSIGEASILVKDLDALQVDNIIVLDRTGTRFQSSTLFGVVDCQIGDPLVATLKAELIVLESNHYALQTHG